MANKNLIYDFIIYQNYIIALIFFIIFILIFFIDFVSKCYYFFI